MPPGLQRADGRCGNVDFLKRGGFQNAVFRALCDAEGPTPCCYNGTCVNRTQDQCVCADCLDMRSRIEAEHATWLPAQAQCRRRKLSVAEMCRLLANSTIVFKGASLVRHLYTGFLLTVTGNDIAGAQAKNIPKGKRERERESRRAKKVYLLISAERVRGLGDWGGGGGVKTDHSLLEIDKSPLCKQL